LGKERGFDAPILSEFNYEIFDEMFVVAEGLCVVVVEEVEVSEVVNVL